MFPKRHQLLSTLLVAAPAAAQAAASDLFTLEPPKSVFRSAGALPGVVHLGMSAPIVDLNGDGRVDVALPGTAGPVLHLRNGARFTSRSLGHSSPSGHWLVAGDLDGDGDVDLMESGQAQFRALRNDGSGRFSDIPLPTGASTFPLDSACALVDLDLDGDLDFVTDMATVLINDGSGSFTDETATRIPPFAFSLQGTLAVLDLEGDGDPDFVTLAGVFVNDGSGVFSTGTVLPLGYGDQLLTTDRDRDGDVDLIARGGSLVLVNDGKGEFDLLTDTARGIVALTDLNGDGWDDALAAGSPGSPIAAAFLGGPNGFGAALPIDLDVTGGVQAMIPGDLNADGHMDFVAIVHRRGDHLPPLAMFGDGTGAFQKGYALSVMSSRGWTYAARAFDADGDGAIDLVGASTVLLNDGAGSLHGVPHNGNAQPTVHGDWDGDGDVDYLSAHRGGLYFVVNDGAGDFAYDQGQAPLVYSTSTTAPLRTEALDWDGDGDVDVVTMSDDLLLWTNDGTGAFAPSVLFPVIGVRSIDFEFHDLNGDGRRDAVILLSSARNQSHADLGILLQDSSGSFALHSWAPFPFVSRVDVADINGDGLVDILASGNGAVPRLLVGHGAVGFMSQSINLPPRELSLVDFDLDGDIDVAVGSAHPELWTNDGQGNFSAIGDLGAQGAPARSWSEAIRFIDLDGDGDPDMLHGGHFNHSGNNYNLFVYRNRTRELRVPGISEAGGPLTIEVGTTAARTAADPTLTAWVWADTSRRSMVIPGVGVAHVDPRLAFFVGAVPLGSMGVTEVTIAVPNSPTFKGQALVLQAALLGQNGIELTGMARDRILR